MENKTAEEQDWCAEMKKELETLNKYNDLLIQEKAEMKKENERLKAELLQRDTTWLPAKDAELELQQMRIKELEAALRYARDYLSKGGFGRADCLAEVNKALNSTPHDTINKP